MAERALVTGGANGIGRSICDFLEDKGFDVVILDKVSPESSFTGKYFQTDFNDETQTESSLLDALKDGPITRLINNVGVVKPALLDNSNVNDFHEVMKVNVLAAVLAARALLPGMKSESFGRIVNISSRTVLGKPLRTNYAASKGALVSLARTWALELSQDGITANVVCPGPIATELYRLANPSDSPRTKASLSNIPVGRIGEPEDIARAVMFFLDTSSSFVTGQTLHVCGGTSVGRADF